MESDLRCGPFALKELLGQGGMGEVWSARGPGGLQAAVKRVAPRTQKQRQIRRLFDNEVRCAAALNHPAIALIYDRGEDSGGPWLAMELASQGTLGQRVGRCSWPELRGWMLQLLEALAEIHARGMVHRDVKPENLLLCSARDPRPGLKLADFGVAWQPGMDPRPAGSPHFWAPEQARGAGRELGPWTDLYAVGRSVLELAGGRSPLAQVGALEWVDRLLAQAPQDRYRRAAEAAWVLHQLPEADWDSERGPVVAVESSTFSWDLDDLPPVSQPAAPEEAVDTSRVIPPWPSDWLGPVKPPAQLPGVGSSLGRLRERPMVGRRGLQLALGATLRSTRGVRHLVLSGGEPKDARSLGDWLERRLLALGTAGVLRLEDSLPGALTQALRCQGLEGSALRAHVQTWVPDLDPFDLDALCALLLERDDAPLGRARAALVRRLLMAWEPGRPWLIWCPDPSNPRLAELLRALEGSPEPAALLLSVEGEVEGGFSATTLEVPPLKGPALRDLLEACLAVEEDSREALLASAQGSAELLMELLWEAVDGGLLRPGPRGYTGDPAALGQLPSSLLEAAERLVGRLQGERRESALILAQLASTLPPQFLLGHLLAAAVEAGLAEPQAALSELLTWRLIQPLRQGQARLASLALRALLAEQVQASPARAELLLAAAKGLQGPLGMPEQLHRASLYLEVGALEPAGRQLEAVGGDWLRTRQLLPSLGPTLKQWASVAEAEGAPEAQSQAHLLLSVLRAQQRRHDDALDHARSARNAARRAESSELLARSFSEMVFLHRQRGEHELAVRAGEQALEHAAEGSEVEQNALLNLGWQLVYSGELNRAEEVFRRALASLAADDHDRLASTHRALGVLWDRRGDLTRALAHCELGVKESRVLGSTNQLYQALLNHGALLQKAGRLDEAAACYREGIDCLALSGRDPLISELNLACLEIERGEVEQGLGLLARIHPRVRRMPPGPIPLAWSIFEGAAHAALGDAAALERSLDSVDALQAQLRFAEEGLARFLRFAADDAQSTAPELAARATQHADWMRQQMGGSEDQPTEN